MNETWIDAASADEIGEGDVVALQAADREVAVCRVGRDFYAVQNTCTHGQARLCDGLLEGYELECPLHQGKFDIRTGRALTAPLILDVRTYAVKVVNGRVLIRLSRELPDCSPEPSRDPTRS